VLFWQVLTNLWFSENNRMNTLRYVLLTLSNLITGSLTLLVNRTNLVHNFFLICSLLLSACFGQLCAHHQEKITVPLRRLVFVTVCRWLSGMRAGFPARIPDSHLYRVTNTRCRKGTVNFSWWWAHSCPKHVEKSNKHIKEILCTKLVLFTRLYKAAQLTKHTVSPPYLAKCSGGTEIDHGHFPLHPSCLIIQIHLSIRLCLTL